MIGLERGRSTAWKSLQISPGDPIMARPFGLDGLVTLSCSKSGPFYKTYIYNIL